MSTAELINKGLGLKPAERFILIQALINSLDMPNPSIEKVWDEEAQNRLKAYKEGRLKTVAFDEL